MKEKRNTTGNIIGGAPKPWKRILAALLTFALVFQQMPAAPSSIYHAPNDVRDGLTAICEKRSTGSIIAICLIHGLLCY